jgi:hypothetical protein
MDGEDHRVADSIVGGHLLLGLPAPLSLRSGIQPASPYR